jgi:hypothetical protein
MNNTKTEIEIIGDENVLSYLENNLCVTLKPFSAKKKKEIIEQSPILGPYLIKGQEKVDDTSTNLIRLNICQSKLDGSSVVESPWGAIIDNISNSIAVVCAAGASKAFIELLKLWVNERKSRSIKIKEGNDEIEIKGGMSEKKIEKVIDMFERRFGKSMIFK